MKEVLVLRELEQIKAISQGYRISILEAFNNKPATAKQISDHLGEPHAKINYHIKTLVKVGILELVEENIKLGIVEKYYCPVARDFVVDSSSFSTNERDRATFEKASVALFELMAKDFYDNVEYMGEKPPKKFYRHPDIYMTKEESEFLNDEINNMIKAFIEDKRETKENTFKYSVSTLMIPIIKK